MMTLALLRAADRATIPWKNGGGVTQTIAADPPGAGLDGFDWRLSMAEVRSKGPFSCFAGVDRILAVLDGALALTIDGAACLLNSDDAPIVFAGDAPVEGGPVDAAAIDLNLMVRRGRSRGTLTRWPIADDAAGATVMLLFAGPGSLAYRDDRLTLGRFDAIRIDDCDPAAITVASDAPVHVAFIQTIS